MAYLNIMAKFSKKAKLEEEKALQKEKELEEFSKLQEQVNQIVMSDNNSLKLKQTNLSQIVVPKTISINPNNSLTYYKDELPVAVKDKVWLLTKQDYENYNAVLTNIKPQQTDFSSFHSYGSHFEEKNELLLSKTMHSISVIKDNTDSKFIKEVGQFVNYEKFRGLLLASHTKFRPCMLLNLNDVAKNKNIFAINERKGVGYLSFGQYPQNFVNGQNRAEFLSKIVSGQICKTGKVFCADYNFDISLTMPEFIDKKSGEKYVCNQYNGMLWYEVKPIEWVILNWKDLPKEINPNGTGVAKDVEIIAKNYNCPVKKYSCDLDKDYSIWSFSRVRAFLNGINLKKQNEKNDFREKYESMGFINDAFSITQLEQAKEKAVNEKGMEL